MQEFLFKLYKVLAVIFVIIAVMFFVVGPIEIAFISLLGLAWSLVGIIINSGYFEQEERR